jgi:hypothetical protein
MPTPRTQQKLVRRRRLAALVLLSAVVALLAGGASVFKVGLIPPSLEPRPLQEGAAVTRAALRLQPRPSLNALNAFEGQAKRGDLIANAMASRQLLEATGRLAEIDPNSITATAELNEGVPRAFSEPGSERRADEILDSHDPYRLDIQARPTVPIIDIYSQAPSVEQAERLANASIEAANRYLVGLAGGSHGGGRPPVTLIQLGKAQGGSLEPAAPFEIAALTFLVTFAMTFGLLFLLIQIRRGWMRAGRVAGRRGQGVDLGLEPPEPIRRRSDDWPHTTRVLPWLIAAFIALVWLVPVNAIWLQVSLPVDLKLDRLVLPGIVLVWLISLAAPGPNRPRLRFTKIHAAIAVFVAVAALSVVANAAYLDQTLELGLTIKKLFLLGAIFSLFLVVASVVRPSEVRPYMTFVLGLATVCAIGMLWEYRTGSNVFYSWSAKILPGIFHATSVSFGYDEVGRREVVGTADLSLEAVAMLAMALPIGLVRLTQPGDTRQRVLYGLATCILLGAMIATYRKSALLAPITVVLVLAYFRRRELLRLAPLGLVIVASIPFLAPNALGSVIDQFAPHRLGVATVSDRVSDYDAIRPDLLSHPALGRGFGSYEHLTYRTLDNDLLMRIVESGLIGLAAYVFMLLMLVWVAAPIIRRRDRDRAPAALAVAAAASAFLVLSALFDIMSFPQTPYILMVLAGFLAVISKGRSGPTPGLGQSEPRSVRRNSTVTSATPSSRPKQPTAV